MVMLTRHRINTVLGVLILLMRDARIVMGLQSYALFHQHTAAMKEVENINLLPAKINHKRRLGNVLSTSRANGEHASGENNLKDSTSSAITTAKSYHLLISKGVPLKIILWTVFVYFLGKVSSHALFLTDANSIFARFLLPLFASACCAGQVLLNIAFAGAGCAGFNKCFGPLRPLFIAVLIQSTYSSFMRYGHHQVLKYILTTSITWLFALMPDMVHWLNMNGFDRFRPLATSESVVWDEKIMSRNVLTLNIPSMGCVGCVDKILTSLRDISSTRMAVSEVKSWLVDPKGGMARVVLSSEKSQSIDNSIGKVVDAVKDAGFKDCCVISVEAPPNES